MKNGRRNFSGFIRDNLRFTGGPLLVISDSVCLLYPDGRVLEFIGKVSMDHLRAILSWQTVVKVICNWLGGTLSGPKRPIFRHTSPIFLTVALLRPTKIRFVWQKMVTFFSDVIIFRQDSVPLNQLPNKNTLIISDNQGICQFFDRSNAEREDYEP